MITNFHTHTSRCRHAWGSDEDYVLEAIKQGYQILGFADHTCWPFLERNVPCGFASRRDTPSARMQDYVWWAYADHHSAMRMGAEELGDYARSIRFLKKKYQHWIDIRLGLEAEYDPLYMDWLLDKCIEYQIEYLILGHHILGGVEHGCYSGSIGKDMLDTYVDSAIEALETGMYAYLAHPELFMRSSLLEIDEDTLNAFTRLAQACARLNIPVEYNCAGMCSNRYSQQERYPHHCFWEIAAKEGCKAVIGMDAHLPECLNLADYNQARTTLEALGMEIVEDIGSIDYAALKERRRAQRALSLSSQPKGAKDGAEEDPSHTADPGRKSSP